MSKVLFLPIGVPTFELVSAKKLFDESVEMLSFLDDQLVAPDDMLLSLDDLNNIIDENIDDTDMVIVQNITFANSAYMETIINKINCPVLLWTLREPVIDGGRLRLNSLTGAFSAGNKMMMSDVRFSYVFGTPKEVKTDVASFVVSACTYNLLKGMHICQIGETPQGFDFGDGDADELEKNLGIKYSFVKAEELMDTARDISDKDALPYLEKAKTRMVGLDDSDEHTMAFAKLYKAYSDYINENEIDAVASRCWPDFFTNYGTPVCSVLAMLNDDGVSASCESDVLGSVSMYICQLMSDGATFFGDPVSLDENENTLTFWHCGTAACSLAREDTGAQVGVHCNRKIGPTLEFGCKPCDDVTIFRVGRTNDGLRFFVSKGEALDKPKQFFGTSVVVKTESTVKPMVEQMVVDGWEPHFVVAMADIRNEIVALANMLGVEVVEY